MGSIWWATPALDPKSTAGGKPCPAPAFDSHGWTGKDRQHWSSLYLTAYYLLTGKHWALREIQNEVQLYLAASWNM